MNNDTNQKSLAFSFTGQQNSLLSLWLREYGKTLITLGGYAPHARLSLKGYAWSHVWLKHENFRIHLLHGNLLPAKIVTVLMVLALLLLLGFQCVIGLAIWAGVLVLGAPFYIRRRLALYASSTVYDNEHFRFEGTYGEAYYVFLGLPLLSVVLPAILAVLTWQWQPAPEIGIVLVALLILVMLVGLGLVTHQVVRYMVNHSYHGEQVFHTSIRVTTMISHWALLVVSVLGIGVVGLALLMGVLYVLGGFDTVLATWNASVANPYASTGISVVLGLMMLAFVHAFIRTIMMSSVLRETTVGTMMFTSRRRLGVVFRLNLLYGLLMIVSLGVLWPMLRIRQLQHLVDHVTLEPIPRVSEAERECYFYHLYDDE
jgi:uncharacterized membrane protein YjgN (DUF898 family)